MSKDFLQKFTNFGQLMADLIDKVKPTQDIPVEKERPQFALQEDGSEIMQEILMMKMASEYNEDMMLNEGTPEEDNRSMQFQRNQNTIKQALIAYINVHGKLPSTSTLSKITDLSRPTIQNHLKEDVLNSIFKQEVLKVQLLSSNLLVKMYKMAEEGDLRAMKLLFDIQQTGHKIQVNTQNNFVQINSLKISNTNLEQLSTKAKNKIESILRNELRKQGRP
jgi:hypothetical protein